MCNHQFCCCNEQQSTYIATGILFFLIGVEYAVIIPTLNLYLASMGASAVFMGFCLSAMSFTSLLSAPIYGRISDITRTTKSIVLISNLFAIAGNFLYAISTSPYMVVISRLIVGISAGSASSVVSMISRSTTKEERASTMSKIFSGRQTGLVIGPAFNLFLKNCDFYVFSFHVNNYNSPGFLMAALWISETILMIFVFHDLEAINSNNTTNNDAIVDDDVSVSEPQAGEINETLDSSPNPERSFLFYVYNDLVTEESVLFLAMTFVIMFVQVGIEALVTPLSKLYFDWGEVENSVFYSGQGVLYMLSLVSVAFVSKKIRDRYLILFGLIFLTLASLSFLILVVYASYQPFAHPTKWMYFLFILYGAIVGLTMAYAWVPLLSLFTKFTSEENQGFTQGIRMVAYSLGKIMGPILVSSLLNRLPLLTSINLGLYVLVLIMFLASYKQIVRRERKLDGDSSSSNSTTSEDSEAPSETSPLLSSSHKYPKY